MDSSSSSLEMELGGMGNPSLDGPGQLIRSLTANLLSTFQNRLDCNRNRTSSHHVSPNNAVVSPLSGENLSPSSTISSLSTSVRVDGLGLGSKAGGPAFVGQVFSMCDPSGTGLMAVTTHFDVPFLSNRTPEWVKKMLWGFRSKNKEGPVFRFFMDLGDAVSYVKKLNIPTGMVGACRLDVAFEHFKEKPHAFQFVPNGKQVREANKLLREARRRGGKTSIGGVPVFTAQNLNIAIATSSGIRWYRPYFFDKKLLDSILEASVDQHFHGLIRQRHSQRRKDVLDGGAAGEVFDDSGESLFDPPEVQELLEELGHPAIPMSVVSKVAEIQILDVVDKVLLGNRWLRKAVGIQPRFPYLVDSFEERTAASLRRAAESSRSSSDLHSDIVAGPGSQASSADCSVPEYAESNRFQFPPMNWGKRLMREEGDCHKSEVGPNSLLPRITMVGISTGEGGRVSKASLKKTMEELTRELEQSNQGAVTFCEDKDPLFVANVGDYSTITRMSSAR